jgi:hypothetical protein
MASAPNDWIWAAMEPPLSDKEKQLRNLFVDEYLVDYDAIAAAQRCGFQASFAKDYAIKFMNESYVRKRIEEVKHTNVDPKKADEFDKARIRAVLMKEAHNQYTTGSARVAAAAKLAAILVVPAIANIDEWEAVAMASQAKLVADVRT